MILEAEADLVPMGPRSPLRFGRRRADIPRMSCGLRSASVVAEQTSPGRLATHLPHGFGCCVAGANGSKVFALLRSAQSRRPPDVLRSPLRFGRCRTDVPRTSCNPSSARLRLLRGRRPWVQGLRFASVGTEQTSPPDVLRSPLRFGRCRTDVLRTSYNPSSALKWGKLNYTDFAQNCILDQKERTSL